MTAQPWEEQPPACLAVPRPSHSRESGNLLLHNEGRGCNMRSSLFNRNRDSGMNDVRLDSIVVYCADIGSVKRGKFGWASRRIGPDPRESGGTDIHQLVKHVASDINSGHKVALGLECPLWVPVSRDARELTSARCGDGNRSWSAAAGATSLATGLTETSWILSGIRKASPHVKAYLDWPRFRTADNGLFLWEAMVTGEEKSDSHQSDAAVAVDAFIRALPNLKSDVTSPHRVRSLIGTALLWAGWSDDLQLLRTPCVVIKPMSRDSRG